MKCSQCSVKQATSHIKIGNAYYVVCNDETCSKRIMDRVGATQFYEGKQKGEV